MVSYLESGQRGGSLRTALAIARALGVTVEQIVSEPEWGEDAA